MRSEKEKTELLIKVFDNQQMLISNADTKTSIALTIQTFIITTVLGAAIIIDAFNKVSIMNAYIKSSYYFLFFSFIVASIVGLTLSILVFKPRPPQEKNEITRRGITYFSHIKGFSNSNEYLKALNELNPDDIIKEFACQNYTLAVILDYKMKYVKCSTTMLFINILLGITVLVFSLAII